MSSALRFATLARTCALGLLTLTLAACENGTAPSNGTVRVTMNRQVASSSALHASMLGGAGFASVPLSAVDSILVTLTAVEALRASADTATTDTTGLDGWVRIELTAPQQVDLMRLPTDTAGGLQLARGQLPEGDYGSLRLRFSDAFITFNREVSVGAQTYPARQRITLEIPSGRNTGIKVPSASFRVEADTTASVRVGFDAASSVAKVTATGSGRVKMSPVLNGRRSGS